MICFVTRRENRNEGKSKQMEERINYWRDVLKDIREKEVKPDDVSFKIWKMNV